MPGPKDFPAGGIESQAPANAVTVDDQLQEDIESAKAAEAADGGASYFPPGEAPTSD